MPPENRDAAYLWDMLQAARDAVGVVAGITREDFLRDRVKMLALERCLELIGEAARRVSERFRKKHPKLPWKEMIGLPAMKAKLSCTPNMAPIAVGTRDRASSR